MPRCDQTCVSASLARLPLVKYILAMPPCTGHVAVHLLAWRFAAFSCSWRPPIHHSCLHHLREEIAPQWARLCHSTVILSTKFSTAKLTPGAATAPQSEELQAALDGKSAEIEALQVALGEGLSEAQAANVAELEANLAAERAHVQEQAQLVGHCGNVCIYS